MWETVYEETVVSSDSRDVTIKLAKLENSENARDMCVDIVTTRATRMFGKPHNIRGRPAVRLSLDELDWLINNLSSQHGQKTFLFHDKDELLFWRSVWFFVAYPECDDPAFQLSVGIRGTPEGGIELPKADKQLLLSLLKRCQDEVLVLTLSDLSTA